MRGFEMNYAYIKELRVRHKISQTKLAEYTHLSKAKISAWEMGKIIPTEIELIILLEQLNKMVDLIKIGEINVIKKRIQQSRKTKKQIPSCLKTAEQYKSRLSCVHYNNTYAEELSILYNKAHNAYDSNIKGIALFSGCGGMTLGFEAAGFNLVGHIEIDPSANEIYNANFPNSSLLKEDINTVTENDLEEWKRKYGEIDVIVGGPPCQGFSLAGKRSPKDERNKLYQQYVRIVASIKPKAFVFENVALLTSMKNECGDLFIDCITKEFHDAGYTICYKTVNAYEFGVPQSRERVIIIGLRDDLHQRFTFPMGEYVEYSNEIMLGFSNEKKRVRTFRDATHDLVSLESGDVDICDPLHWAIVHPEHVVRWLKPVQEGHSAHENKENDMRPPSGFNTTYKRIVWDEPCSTISTNFSMISGCRNVHPTNTRSLTIREATRAQSFPDEYVFFGKWGDVRRAIGNAVPPLLAYEIAKSLKKQIFD